MENIGCNGKIALTSFFELCDAEIWCNVNSLGVNKLLLITQLEIPVSSEKYGINV